MKDNFIIRGFNYSDRTEYRNIILDFILKGEAEKIIYQGDPKLINYKKKRCMFLKAGDKMSLKKLYNYTDEVIPKTDLVLIIKK